MIEGYCSNCGAWTEALIMRKGILLCGCCVGAYDRLGFDKAKVVCVGQRVSVGIPVDRKNYFERGVHD